MLPIKPWDPEPYNSTFLHHSHYCNGVLLFLLIIPQCVPHNRGRTPYSLCHLQGVPCARRLGWYDVDFECSTVCPILRGLMGIWQRRLVNWARWWNPEIKLNPTQVYEHMGRPVYVARE